MHFRRTIISAVLVLTLVTAGLFPDALWSAEDSPRDPVAARNPLRDRGFNDGIPSVTGADVLAQLRADANGSDKVRAIIAIHRLEKCGVEGAAILAHLLTDADLPMEIQFPTLNALTAIGPPAVPVLLELL